MFRPVLGGTARFDGATGYVVSTNLGTGGRYHVCRIRMWPSTASWWLASVTPVEVFDPWLCGHAPVPTLNPFTRTAFVLSQGPWTMSRTCHRQAVAAIVATGALVLALAAPAQAFSGPAARGHRAAPSSAPHRPSATMASCRASPRSVSA